MNAIKFVQIEPTTRCNFSCSFCSGRFMKQYDMDFSMFQDIVDKLPEIKYMELQGEGEPFLHSRIYDMIRYAKDHGIQVSSISNGSLLKGNAKKIIDSGLDSLNISIESTDEKEFHAIRGGDLDIILEGIEQLVQEKKKQQVTTPAIGFSVTVLKSTASKLNSIFSLYKELEMDGGISIQFLNESNEYNKNYTEKENKEYLTPREKQIVRRDYFRGLTRIEENEEAQHFFTKIENEVKQNAGRAGYCIWLENGIYINCQGYVTSCVYMKDGENFGLGHMEKDTIEHILSLREEEREAIKSGRPSSKCLHIHCEVVKKIKEKVENEKRQFAYQEYYSSAR